MVISLAFSIPRRRVFWFAIQQSYAHCLKVVICLCYYHSLGTLSINEYDDRYSFSGYNDRERRAYCVYTHIKRKLPLSGKKIISC